MSKSIGEILEQFFAGRLSSKAPLEAQLRETWHRLMGAEIASATTRIMVSRQRCVIYLKDPLLREELRYRASQILEAFQAAGFPDLRKVEIRHEL
ncbi:MAG: DUF721 domain-containing protein [Bacteroidia bacterium]